MKKLFAAMLALSCLWLAACTPEQSAPTDPTEVKKPTQSVVTTNPDGSVNSVAYVYDEDGILLERNHYTDGVLTVSYAAHSDEAGRLGSLADEKGTSGLSVVYTYDDRGNTARIEIKLNGETYFIQSYTYNEDGTLDTYTEEDLRSTETVLYKYLYEEGVMTWEEYYENGELRHSWEYTYNGQRCVSAIQWDADFAETATRKFAYADGCETVTTYDMQGNVTATKESWLDADNHVVKEIFTVDGQMTVTEYTYNNAQ